MTFSEEFEHIKAAIYDNPRSDGNRIEQCFAYSLADLYKIACKCDCAGDPECPSLIARQSLRRMEMRVRLGDDQPAGADITYPWEDVLSPGPDGGDWG